MSLSDPLHNTPPAGRIIIGLGDKCLDDLHYTRPQTAWDQETENRFMERVRARAREEAREILAGAAKEAEFLRSEALKKGLEQGKKEARQELDALQAEQKKTLSRVLQGILDDCRKVQADRLEDMVLVLRLALEKTLALELEENRDKILTSLFKNALERLENKQHLRIEVAPKDEKFMVGLLEAARKDDPSLGAWKIQANADLTAGGIIIEGSDGIVDNSIATRMQAVREVLEEMEIVDQP
jgi:flagellar assembly protein FliH